MKKKKRTLYECFNAKVDTKRIYCGKGYPLTSEQVDLPPMHLEKGEPPAKICRQYIEDGGQKVTLNSMNCPRCTTERVKGRLELIRDVGETYYLCINCGYEIPISDNEAVLIARKAENDNTRSHRLMRSRYFGYNNGNFVDDILAEVVATADITPSSNMVRMKITQKRKNG